MSNGTYILDEWGDPVEEPDLLVWGRWMKGAFRRVLLTDLDWCKVSTVFRGLDHSFGFMRGPRPILWETIVFGGVLDLEMRRYASRDDAIVGHYEMVDECRKARRKFYARLRRIRKGSTNEARRLYLGGV